MGIRSQHQLEIPRKYQRVVLPYLRHVWYGFGTVVLEAERPGALPRTSPGVHTLDLFVGVQHWVRPVQVWGLPLGLHAVPVGLHGPDHPGVRPPVVHRESVRRILPTSLLLHDLLGTVHFEEPSDHRLP